MQSQKTYRHSPAKIIFALAFLISLSFSKGVGSNITLAFQGKAKTELVVSHKVKIPGWIKSLQKKVSLKTFPKSQYLIKYEAGYLSSYNLLTKIKFKNLSQLYSSIKSPYSLIRVKTIPQTSKEIDLIS